MNWQPIPNLTAPHYLDTGLNQVQKCVNWYHEKTPDGLVLKSFTGYQLKDSVANNAACRGAIFVPGYGLFSVHGNTVYKIASDGSDTALTGTLSTSSGYVKLAYSSTQIMVTDLSYGYIISPLALSVTKITDSNFPSDAFSCACINEQFLVVKGGTDRWYMSAVGDGLTWTPVISGRAMTNGDLLIGVEVVRDVVYFIGSYTTEQWAPSSIDPYLQPITGATLPIGTFERTTIARINDSILMLAMGAYDRPSVWKIEGGQAAKIAPPYIDNIVGNWALGAGTTRAFAYSNLGNSFYELYNTNDSNNPAWVYNISSGVWFETSSSRTIQAAINAGAGGVPPFGFDTTNGNVYWLGCTGNEYNQFLSGNAITRILDFKVDGGVSRTFNAGLRFEFEVKHDSSSSYSLSATLQKSDDAGLTFDTGVTLSKAITSGTSAQQVILTSPPLGSFKAGRIYRLTFAGPAARLILRRAEGLVQIGRF